MESEPAFDLKEFTLKEKIYSGVSSEVYKVMENRTSNIYATKISQSQISPKSKIDSPQKGRKSNLFRN